MKAVSGIKTETVLAIIKAVYLISKFSEIEIILILAMEERWFWLQQNGFDYTLTFFISN